MAIGFEWDEPKAAANFRKHGVTFEECVSVFENPLAVVFDDDAHPWLPRLREPVIEKKTARARQVSRLAVS